MSTLRRVRGAAPALRLRDVLTRAHLSCVGRVPRRGPGISVAAAGVVALLASVPVFAQIAMPDASLIHGRAIPAPELPDGTVTVRVVREAIGNNVAGQEVHVTAGGAIRSASTDELGRAEFAELPAGVSARAETSVDGEALVSEPFAVPASGGLRVILVAGLDAAAARAEREAQQAAAAPVVPGAVVLGPNSRILMEFRDDSLHVFYVLDILNNARAPVDIGGPLIVDLPTGAAGASVLQGSTPAASVSGDRVTVTGPFASGVTPVQVAFRFPYDRSDVAMRQTFPVRLEQLTVGIERIGDVSIASPQFSTVGEVRAETGSLFLLASGPAMAAGSTLTMELSNLPVHSRMPLYVTLALAVTIMGWGAWVAFRRSPDDRGAQQRLVQRREKLLGDLAALQARVARGSALAPADETRRQRLFAELEQVYGELDHVTADPRGGGKDVAA